jgi:hypothetical protein
MELTYDRLSCDELGGSTQADLLVALDGRLRLNDDGAIVFDETQFPVVELARSLVLWLAAPGRPDFGFVSMSCDDGAISILQDDRGWHFRSTFYADPLTGPVDWSEVERCCRNFIVKVRADLQDLGLRPDQLLR